MLFLNLDLLIGRSVSIMATIQRALVDSLKHSKVDEPGRHSKYKSNLRDEKEL